MRPLPQDKTHGIIHSVRVRKDHVDQLAKDLGLSADEKRWLQEGEIHIVREAKESEINRNKK